MADELFSADFDTDAEGFVFRDDAFRAAFLRDLGAGPGGLHYDQTVEDTLDALAQHMEAHLDVSGLLDLALEVVGDQSNASSSSRTASKAMARRKSARPRNRSSGDGSGALSLSQGSCEVSAP